MGEVVGEDACNRIDDDCNGMIDDGNLCGVGQVCMIGECIGGMSVPLDAGTGPTDSGTPIGSDAGVEAGIASQPPTRSCAALPGLLPLAALLWVTRRKVTRVRLLP